MEVKEVEGGGTEKRGDVMILQCLQLQYLLRISCIVITEYMHNDRLTLSTGSMELHSQIDRLNIAGNLGRMSRATTTMALRQKTFQH